MRRADAAAADVSPRVAGRSGRRRWKVLFHTVRRQGCDVALVAPDAASFSAAQTARRQIAPPFLWAGLSEPLEQSRDFFDVLLSLGEMHRAVNGCRLLFIADEAAKLEARAAEIRAKAAPKMQN